MAFETALADTLTVPSYAYRPPIDAICVQGSYQIALYGRPASLAITVPYAPINAPLQVASRHNVYVSTFKADMDTSDSPATAPTEIALAIHLTGLGYREDMVGPYVIVDGCKYGLAEAKPMSNAVLIAKVENERNWRHERGRWGDLFCMCRWPFRPMCAKFSALARPHLACYPNDTLKHSPKCPFRSYRGGDPERSWELPAPGRDSAGRLRIHFVVPLDASLPRFRRRRTTKALGLLLSLVDKAGTQDWHGQSGRTFTEWGTALSSASHGLSVDGALLSEHLLMPGLGDDAEDEARLAMLRRMIAFTPHSSAVRRGILIGEVTDKKEVGDGASLYLRGLSAPLLLGPDALKRVKHSFSREWNAKKKAGSSCIAITVVECGPDGDFLVGRIALARVTRDYILVESIVEAAVVNGLVDERRVFLKPVRKPPGFPFRPDILLNDTVKPWPMEIYAFWTVRYQLDKDEKIRVYGELEIEVWVWNGRGEWTPFPPVASIPRNSQ